MCERLQRPLIFWSNILEPFDGLNYYDLTYVDLKFECYQVKKGFLRGCNVKSKFNNIEKVRGGRNLRF